MSKIKTIPVTTRVSLEAFERASAVLAERGLTIQDAMRMALHEIARTGTIAWMTTSLPTAAPNTPTK